METQYNQKWINKLYIYKPLNKRNSGPDSFIGDFYQTFEKELIFILKLFQKINK